MRRLLTAISAAWMLVGAFAPGVLAATCERAAPHACCTTSSGATAAQVASCAPSCACDELRGAPPAPATFPERLSAPAPVAVLVAIVPALSVSNTDLRLDLQPQPPDLASALGPPLRLRI